MKVHRDPETVREESALKAEIVFAGKCKHGISGYLVAKLNGCKELFWEIVCATCKTTYSGFEFKFTT